MPNAEKKSINAPDETRKFEKGRVELVNIGGGAVGRFVYEPGWKWSSHVKPIAGTDLCEAPHFTYLITGRMHIAMADGTGLDLEPGDVTQIPPGHDGWVVGDEVVTGIDWAGMAHFAESK